MCGILVWISRLFLRRQMDITAYARMGLEAELARLDEKRAEVLALLAQIDRRPTKGREATGRQATPAKQRKMSAEGRERIREAVQRRWARVRAEQGAGKGEATRAGGTSPVNQDVEPAKAKKRTRTIPRTGNRKK
jgi:hypothetical protein